MFENREYFKLHKYRNPDDEVVKSYVMPKIKFMEDSKCFQKEEIKILDVASGNGTFSQYFKNYTNNIVSLDYSEQLLESNPCRFRTRADVYQMPFKDDQFDIVFEANLLHHLNKPYYAIKEMKRCSREYLVFIEPNRYNPLMCIFSLLVIPERGGLMSFRRRWEDIIKSLGMEVSAGIVTGMISQEHTPAFMAPFLKLFDFNFCLGEYIVLICKKYSA